MSSQTFDLLVVGGGATGAATARDAALRGLQVALVEAGDFAGETSSRSSKLIHGGIRYLQYGDFPLVFEGLAERARLMRIAPHLCRPVDFLFPAFRGERPGLAALGVGVRLYNALALGREPSGGGGSRPTSSTVSSPICARLAWSGRISTGTARPTTPASFWKTSSMPSAPARR